MLRMLVSVVVALAAVVLISPQSGFSAPWCGTVSPTDRPGTVTGPPIRVIYAIGSDGVDRSAEFAPMISSDVDEIEAWWRLQDSARIPRFDRAPFSCGPQADIRLVRLPQSSGDLYSDTNTTFSAIRTAVTALDSVASNYKYLVYFDAPQRVPNVCGVGSGSFSGSGVAVVLLGACQGVQNAPKATHELLHAFGALPAGAPHGCPTSPGHPCDATGDILYPFVVPVSLGSYALDVGHDDYYGHAGAWPDIQDSRWLIRLDAQLPLSVGIAGAGRVTSDVPGVDCTASCTTTWNGGATVHLVAAPADGLRFVRWSGACQGITTTCDLTLAQAAETIALFAPMTYTLTASVRGSGRLSGPGGLMCQTSCSKELESYRSVTIIAKAAPGWRIDRWNGPVASCRGLRARCTVPMTAVTAVKAVFVRKR